MLSSIGGLLGRVLQDADILQIAIFLGVIQTVSDDEAILDAEADIFDLDVDLPAGRLDPPGDPPQP